MRTLILFTAVALAAGTASAQIVPKKKAQPATESPKPAPASSSSAPAAESDTKKASTPIQKGPDLSAPANKLRVPANDESVYVVQKRAYSKAGKFEITPIFNTAVNPKFVGYIGASLAVAYHFKENLALEFMTSIYQYAFYSDLVYEVWRYEDLFPQEVDLKKMLYFNALSLQFSAFYGKLELYGYLVDYDFYVTGGLGYALTREPCAVGDATCGEEDEVGRGLRFPDRGLDQHKITGNLGLGIRVFFHEMFGVRVEFRDIAYPDRKVETTQAGSQGVTGTDIHNTMMLVLGASIML